MPDETAELMGRLNRDLLETRARHRAAIARVRAVAERWTGDPSTLAAGREILAALVGEQGMPWAETHVLIGRAAIECVLLDHAEELDDEAGCVDANLAELAHEYRGLTGFDAKASWAAAATWAADRAADLREEQAGGEPRV